MTQMIGPLNVLDVFDVLERDLFMRRCGVDVTELSVNNSTLLRSKKQSLDDENWIL